MNYMKTNYKNRYGDIFTFELQDDGNILWSGNFKYCRFGFPNDYTKAYEKWRNDFPKTEMLSLEDFKNVVHQYDDETSQYIYDKYVRMIEPIKDKIDMVDPSGGCYLSSGMTLSIVGFPDLVVKEFEQVETGFKIITQNGK